MSNDIIELREQLAEKEAILAGIVLPEARERVKRDIVTLCTQIVDYGIIAKMSDCVKN